jgi:hypothetical protein
MSDPAVIDVRDGLTEEALDCLRQATRLQAALKDSRTAVLGLWSPTAHGDVMTVLILPRSPFGREDLPSPHLLFQGRGPASGGPWKHIADRVKRGDRVSLTETDHREQPYLTVMVNDRPFHIALRCQPLAEFKPQGFRSPPPSTHAPEEGEQQSE